MLLNLERSSQPLFQRQLAINECLGKPGRFTGHIRDLSPSELVRLLLLQGSRRWPTSPHRNRDPRAAIGLHPGPNWNSSRTGGTLTAARPSGAFLDRFEDLPSICRDEPS